MNNTRRGLPLTSSRLERIFPKLIPDQIRRVAAQGHIRSVQPVEVLIGSIHSAGTLRIKEFLMRNGHPYSYIDLERDSDVQKLLDSFLIAASEMPVLICRGQLVLRSPSNQQIAACLGFNESVDQTKVRDLVIIGAGPSGLAAAVHGASEGLDVLLLETSSPG